MNLRNRPGRIAATVGAVLAASAATMTVVVAGTASADEPGRCLQNVNVREEPDATSRIVALCEAGTKVKLGETRDGFVRIKELGGWAAQDYVKADDPAAARTDGGSSSESGDGARSSSSEDGNASGRSESGRSSRGSDRSGSGDSGSDGAPDEVEDIEGLLG